MNFEPTHKKLVAVGVAFLVVIGVAVGGKFAGAQDEPDTGKITVNGESGTKTVSPGPEEPPKIRFDVFNDKTLSATADESLRDARVANLSAAAARLRAGVTVHNIDGSPATSAGEVATIDFGRGCTTDNSFCAPEGAPAQELHDQLAADDSPLATTTDLPGVLARLERDQAEAGPGVKIIGIIISDGVSSVPTCDMSLIGVPPTTGALDRCVSPYGTVDLHGMLVVLVGAGQSHDPKANTEVLARAPAIDLALVQHVHGSGQLVNLDDNPARLIELAGA